MDVVLLTYEWGYHGKPIITMELEGAFILQYWGIMIPFIIIGVLAVVLIIYVLLKSENINLKNISFKKLKRKREID